MPVVLVGGGSVLIDCSKNLIGSSRTVSVEHFSVKPNFSTVHAASKSQYHCDLRWQTQLVQLCAKSVAKLTLSRR